METWDAIRARRATREYDTKPIDRADLERILEAGRRAPSSRNDQRWHFVLIQDRDQLEKISKVWQGAAHIANAAAAVGLVAPAGDELGVASSINYDLGQAAMSMMIAAADLGIGSRTAAVRDHELASEVLGLPDGLQLTWLLGLGYPADRPLKPIKNPARRPLDEVVHHDRW
ncbi:MAG TPA: nitroreductase family protein [Acidimicrobiia bacterium]|nr:nitroreductase family protein [Acidimicrobiia bacterium]